MVDGALLELDIKEPAENGMGPHGLCVGATGSGKSELLRTIALGMMARNSPEVLNLLLIDFKGGATFLDLARSPHVAAVITNLAEEAPLVARMRDALAGEMNRRQQLLRAAGCAGVAAYERARLAGRELTALPTLFIIVDEFSELLSQHPDFADMFVAIGRLGRSLGMHLLLASQRLDEGRLRGLEAHLSYRICLKVLSASESRTVLGTLDAYQLPNTPGAGFLRSSTGEPLRFQAAFVSGPLQGDAPASEQAPRTARLFTSRNMGLVGPTAGRRVGTQRFAGGPGPSVWARTARASSLAAAAAPVTGNARPVKSSWTWAGRPDRAHWHRGPPVRAVQNTIDGRVIRSRRQCRGYRCASNGQVDGAAHADHGAGGDPRSGTGAVLLPGLRRRGPGLLATHTATCGCGRRQGRAAAGRPHDRRAGVGHAVAGGVVPRASRRLDRALPSATSGAACGIAHRPVRGRVPRRGRLGKRAP